MKLQRCIEAGLIYEGPNGPVFNETRFFGSLSYPEVIDLWFGCRSIDRGEFKAEYAEAYLERKANNNIK